MYFYRAKKIDDWSAKDYEEVNNLIIDINAASLEFDKTRIELDKICSKPNIEQVEVQTLMFENGLGFFQIFEKVGYLRKVNAIHNWLVKNIQDGKDECQSSIFTKDKIMKLKHTCRFVMKDILDGPSMLPTTKGFFFGSTGYDISYIQDVKEAHDICENILNTTNFDKQVILYRASW